MGNFATGYIRRAGITALKQNAALTALVPAARVYPMQRPAEPVWPFVAWGAPITEPFIASCLDGSVTTFAVHCYAETTPAKGGEDAADELCAAIAKALDGQALALAMPDMVPAALGPELAENGGFDSDTWWLRGDGVTIADGVATLGPAGTLALTRLGLLQADRPYQIGLDVVGATVTADAKFHQSGWTPATDLAGLPVGRHVFTLTATGANFYISNYSGSVQLDNLSIREVLAPAYTPPPPVAHFTATGAQVLQDSRDADSFHGFVSFRVTVVA